MNLSVGWVKKGDRLDMNSDVGCRPIVASESGKNEFWKFDKKSIGGKNSYVSVVPKSNSLFFFQIVNDTMVLVFAWADFLNFFH